MKQNEAKEQDDIIKIQIQHSEPALYIIKYCFGIFISLKYYVRKIILIIFDFQDNNYQKWQETQQLKR